MVIPKKPHRMDRFVVKPIYSDTREGEFGLKVVKARPESLQAALLYYFLHTGRKAEVAVASDGLSIEPVDCGAMAGRGAVCVDARIPTERGVGKVFGGLPLPEEIGARRRKVVEVVGHTDCGFMKFSLAVNLAAAQHIRERGLAPSAEELVGVKAPLVEPLGEVVEAAERLELDPAEVVKKLIREMVLRRTIKEKKGRLYPQLPFFTPNLLKAEMGEEEKFHVLLTYTIEVVKAHAAFLEGLGYRAKPLLYITETGGWVDLEHLPPERVAALLPQEAVRELYPQQRS